MNIKTVTLSYLELKLLEYVITRKQRLFIYNSTGRTLYLPLLDGIFLTKKGFDFTFSTFLTFKILNAFIKQFLFLIRNSEKEFVKILILKGLGFKINLLLDTKQIIFKLGFSHLVIQDIPKKISLTLKRKTLYIKSQNPLLLGNFSETLKNFKQPNSYNGKGFRYKNEILLYKLLKKK